MPGENYTQLSPRFNDALERVYAGAGDAFCTPKRQLDHVPCAEHAETSVLALIRNTACVRRSTVFEMTGVFNHEGWVLLRRVQILAPKCLARLILATENEKKGDTQSCYPYIGG